MIKQLPSRHSEPTITIEAHTTWRQTFRLSPNRKTQVQLLTVIVSNRIKGALRNPIQFRT